MYVDLTTSDKSWSSSSSNSEENDTESLNKHNIAEPIDDLGVKPYQFEPVRQPDGDDEILVFDEEIEQAIEKPTGQLKLVRWFGR